MIDGFESAFRTFQPSIVPPLCLLCRLEGLVRHRLWHSQWSSCVTVCL